MHPRLTSLRRWTALVVLLVSAVGSQVVLEGRFAAEPPRPGMLWVRSPDLLRRLSLGFGAVAADVYWIRAVQYYGDTALSTSQKKAYNLLYPLLDATTTLDPRFNIAYRFGAIFLSEGYPNGPGDTEQAIALLEKGARAMPDKWQYFHDAGFVCYWWRRDAQAAAQWFQKAAAVPGSPVWLRPVAARMLAEGGEAGTARALWLEMAANTDLEWMRQAAARGLMQLDAEAHIELLERIVKKFHDDMGRFPASWDELVRARRLRQPPVDPTNRFYTLDPASGSIDVSPESPLYPLRRRSAFR